MRRARRIRLGGPFDDRAETGPLISAAHRDKVTEYVRKGLEEGARLRCGGEWGSGELESGYYYLPTVLDRVRTGMSVVIEEAFGPVVTVDTFSTEDEAVAIANDPQFGLAAAGWTQDAGRCQRAARRLRHGTVWINGFHPYLSQAEWGGTKQFGTGQELGSAGLAEYPEIKHVHHNTRPSVSGWFSDDAGVPSPS